MNDGIIIINKNAGVTSHDIVNRVRRLFATGQVGHTGTLDPMATGVLCVLVGRAVKASEYITAYDKRYKAVLKLGITTDTEDITGKILTSCGKLPAESEVFDAARSFIGDIMQIPPMYSALKRDGHKLSDLARQGITVERDARPVTIYSLDIMTLNEETGEYQLDIKCSKGTYIRTLCADIGAKLGCGGVMSSLERTASGVFKLENSYTVNQLENMSLDERKALLLDTETVFSELEIIYLPEFFARLANSGAEIYLKKINRTLDIGQRIRMYDSKGFFSLGEVREYPDGPAIRPIKKFRL